MKKKLLLGAGILLAGGATVLTNILLMRNKNVKEGDQIDEEVEETTEETEEVEQDEKSAETEETNNENEQEQQTKVDDSDIEV